MRVNNTGDYEVALISDKTRTSESYIDTVSSKEGWYYYAIPRAWYRGLRHITLPFIVKKWGEIKGSNAIFAHNIHLGQRPEDTIVNDLNVRNETNLPLNERELRDQDDMDMDASTQRYRVFTYGTSPLLSQNNEIKLQTVKWFRYFWMSLNIIDSLTVMTIVIGIAVSLILRNDRIALVVTDELPSLLSLLFIALSRNFASLTYSFKSLVEGQTEKPTIYLSLSLEMIRFRNYLIILNFFISFLYFGSTRFFDIIIIMLSLLSLQEVKKANELTIPHTGLHIMSIDED